MRSLPRLPAPANRSRLAVVCLAAWVVGTCPCPAARADAARWGESPRDRDTSAATEFEFGPGVQTLTEPDLHDIYGLLPSVGAGVSWRLEGDTRLFAGLRFAVSHGDPYYDLPDMAGGDEARLIVVPATLGLGGSLKSGSRFRWRLGGALQLSWIRETLPAGGGLGSSSGFGFGPLVTTGPEWRLGDGRRGVGLEVGWGSRGGHLAGSGTGHDVDLAGYHFRLYWVIRPGAPAPRGEVTP